MGLPITRKLCGRGSSLVEDLENLQPIVGGLRFLSRERQERYRLCDCPVILDLQ